MKRSRHLCFLVQIKGEVNGYVAYFQLVNGFEAHIVMTVEELQEHGKKYSKTYEKGVWKEQFNAMCKKTVLKLLLSRFAPLSIEMQKAISPIKQSSIKMIT